MSRHLDLRLLGAVLLAALGWTLGDIFLKPAAHAAAPLLLVGLVLGFVVGPIVAAVPVRHTVDRLSHVSAEKLLGGMIGLGCGLLVSVLISASLFLVHIPERYWWFPLLLTLLISYVCLRIAMARSSDLHGLFAHGSLIDPATDRSGIGYRHILLDTSAIIDGRIADISQTGFISAELVIPHFVLDELQHIADSSDAIRRNRGRRGLDMLNKMRKDSLVPITIMDVDVKDVQEVDGKLIQLARSLRAPIITQDSNLNKVAELQGVVALNVNTLAHAVKPLVLPGEEMAVHIIQSGREQNQGVGYLDDGTMIVVEDGQRYLNRDVEIVVTRVLQTVAGRMIFAHPKLQGGTIR